jgi:hypothetical protein
MKKYLSALILLFCFAVSYVAEGQIVVVVHHHHHHRQPPPPPYGNR